MANEIVVKKTFQEKMKDRIVDSIGELMDDEELSKLVERATEEVFFKEREIKTNTWESNKVKPPFLHEIVKELLTESVNKHVSKYIDDHHEEVLKEITRVMELGMGHCLMKAITQSFSMELSQFQMNLENKLSQNQ